VVTSQGALLLKHDAVDGTELAEVTLGAGSLRGVGKSYLLAVRLRVRQETLGRRVVIRTAVRGTQVRVVALECVLLERVARGVELRVELIKARGTAALNLLDDLLARGGVLPLQLRKPEEAPYVRLTGREDMPVDRDLKKVIVLGSAVKERKFLD
jgi:hypothetical protein